MAGGVAWQAAESGFHGGKEPFSCVYSGWLASMWSDEAGWLAGRLAGSTTGLTPQCRPAAAAAAASLAAAAAFLAARAASASATMRSSSGPAPTASSS